MCGRYVFNPDDHFYERWDVDEPEAALRPSYNVAPGMIMPVITKEGRVHLQEMKWGLIPFWAKDPKIGYRTINARSEDVATKPSFRGPFKNKRCLVPANGFYEWGTINNERTPYYFKLKSGQMMAFAGLYDEWKDVEGKVFKTFTILTTQANKVVGKIHDRMPVILHKEDEDTWADSTQLDMLKLSALLQPYADSEMESYPVSKAVNSPKSADTEALIKPAGQ
jgi:putative SOS response-associated peptidase YedK